MRTSVTYLIFYKLPKVTYSTNFFCFHIYDMDFHALSNDVSQVLGNNFSQCVFAT